MPRVLSLLFLVVSVSCNSPSLVSVHTSYSVQQQQQQQQSPTTNVYLESSVSKEPSHDTSAIRPGQAINEPQTNDLPVTSGPTTVNFAPQRFDPIVTPGPALNVRQYIQHGRQRMQPFRRPPSPNRRQYGPGVFLSPPAQFSAGPPKRSIPTRPISPPPKPSHLIYSKPPPEVIYYGPNPPPLDHSPPSYRTRPVLQNSGPAFSSAGAYPSGSAFSSRPSGFSAHPSGFSAHPSGFSAHPSGFSARPSGFSAPQGTLPEDHDVMNDLDMYIPDEEPSSLSSKSSSTMSSMMMPLMMLGLTLPALGFMLTYLGRRRRRRDVGIRSSDQHYYYYLQQLNQAIQKYKKRA